MKKFLFLICMSMGVFAKGKENLEFQCTLENGAVVTIHSTKPDYIYRYTKNGKVELKIQQTKELVDKNSREDNSNFRTDSPTRSLLFKNGSYNYDVYSGYSFLGEDGFKLKNNGTRSFASVDVEYKGKSFKELKCVKVKQPLSW